MDIRTEFKAVQLKFFHLVLQEVAKN